MIIRYLAKYILFIYLNFIKDENEDIYKKWASPIFKFVTFIRAIYMTILSILFFPIFMIGMEIDKSLYKYKNIYSIEEFEKIINEKLFKK